MASKASHAAVSHNHPDETTRPVAIRPKPQGLMARLVATRCSTTLADGRTLTALPGDWMIFRGGLALDVLSPERYATEYEPIPQAVLTLTLADTNALDERLGLGATQDATALLTAIDRLAAVRIGDIRIPFTPGQLAELQHRAAKRGRTVEAEMRAVVARIENELFHQGG